ncbi:enoyl-CoA hydratase [Notoacmeibacter ruber]|uniref:enoyl-CoA hydratase n=1 Tax=Notoacmeibacter ruber TaxID=2670375 RepID=A0A3L7JIB1_9HYPH|nr:enoyl-CoA hydratase [Notoacmeibacter ruber]RLQ88222.1 enoyl-CoA hydratase [Notoacmeibacter ruber]
MAVVETRTEGDVGILTVNRPEALNAVNDEVIDGLVEAVEAFDADERIGAMIITGGGEKAFIAGADIKAMSERSYMDMFMNSKMNELTRLTRVRKPIIAAVNGFALGGGCEIAMMCDLVIASEKAKFGQPEIRLGVIPGWGGTQRLTRAIGKAKAMDLVLTGRMMDAQEAERSGLVSRIVPPESLMETAIEAAQAIAGFGRPAVMVAKEAVNRAQETTLAEGLLFEQRLFYSLFATEDQKEGMAAFIEKRQPSFKNK